MNLIFKKLGGEIITDIGAYAQAYLTSFPDTSVYVGTDSIQSGHFTKYVTVVAFYDETRRDGVHYLFSRDSTKRERDLFTRMWKELEMTLAVAEVLEKELEGYVRRFKPEELVKMRDATCLPYAPNQTKLVNLDIDINPDLGQGRNKSNVAYMSAKGYLTGLGYRARFKPHAWAATCAADMMCKKKKRGKPKKLR